ncbi:MAG: class I SAM-dependent methyltransferase [Ilumatobacteraceae bacterium]
MAVRAFVSRTAALVPAPVRDVLRPAARRVGLAAAAGDWTAQANPPWAPPARGHPGERWCNVCRWSGPAFDGHAHTESAGCPQCGSIARDRFLLWCFASRTPDPDHRRVIETSPRLGEDYRAYMQRWFDYRTSDFDLSAHTGDIQLDLQDIDLPDAAVDIVLTPHVLEHVPDTDRAIAELHRVIAPGGRMYLQVPLQQGTTAPPVEPEFHGDNTPVFWRFGWDLTERLRSGGFTTTALVTAEFASMLTGERPAPDTSGSEFDLASIVAAARPDDLEIAATNDEASLMGFEPAHQFATWECVRE